MKALDSFTVERLEELGAGAMFFTGDEVAALARIALAAKRAEPDYYILRLEYDDAWGGEILFSTYETELEAIKSKSDHGGEIIPAYTTPQLSSPEIPDGWKLTPINPTAEMMAAAMECDDVAYDLDDDTIFCVQFDNIYAAMLAAAPEKP
ncbi:hypothetical protein EGX47_02045 [Yersinia pseudotuberculosis]|uniref:Uncharacterized protein n=1 Tax=Yersinia pseudotuberculosis TaxID=633 RepID=A0ABM7ACY2_YERPU|nr:hypothetical protein [Yersinia pseudotuberculosis]AYW90239.1 hypothetical protein EGX47_02045 [Yersinia pseudotuberculosis]